MASRQHTGQISLFDHQTKKRYSRTKHGGDINKGKRKLERPLSTKHVIHLTLKSDKAKGALSFLTFKNQNLVREIIREKAKKFGVRIADMANVGDHIHLKLRIQSRRLFQNFLRAITTLIARKVTGAKKGKAFGRFWSGLAFTRVLKSFKEEQILTGYFIANRLEACTSYTKREKLRREFNDYVYGRGKFAGQT